MHKVWRSPNPESVTIFGVGTVFGSVLKVREVQMKMTNEALQRRAHMLTRLYLKSGRIAQNSCGTSEATGDRNLGVKKFRDDFRRDIVCSVANEGENQGIAKAVFALLASPDSNLGVTPEVLGRVISEMSGYLEPWILLPLRPHIIRYCRSGSKLKPVRTGLKAALQRIRVIRKDLRT